MTLEAIISNLQDCVVNSCLDKNVVSDSIARLSAIGNSYDYDSFPSLSNTDTFDEAVGDAPASLAEALLWKLGRWKAYKKFAKNYSDNNAVPTNQDVVLFAFSKHLKNMQDFPIYDQHAIRALWAIDPTFSLDDAIKCKNLLFGRNEMWKASGSGKYAVDCYNIFLQHVEKIESKDNAPSKEELDRLLMPLGQMIKESSATFADFKIMCGW